MNKENISRTWLDVAKSSETKPTQTQYVSDATPTKTDTKKETDESKYVYYGLLG